MTALKVYYTRESFAPRPDFHFGEHTYGIPEVYFAGTGTHLTIGRYCSIADNVGFYMSGNHRTDWVTTYPFSALDKWPEAAGIPGHPATKGNIVVGNDVWIGMNSMIMSGVTIGDGAVIAAGSVVTKDIPPYVIAGGNRAKPIRQRFSDAQIADLLELRWWDWPDDRVRRNLPLMLSGDIDAFLEANRAAPDGN